MKKKSANFKTCLRPVPDLLISCRDREGNDNALAVEYACNCSFDPPMVMVGIVPTRYSYPIIKETGVFVVNLVTEALRKQYKYLGTHSGKDEDKLAKLGMNIGEGVKVNAPLLLDCPVNIECSVVDSIKTGSHEMFIGKINYVHANKGIVDTEGNIDYSKIQFLKFR
ncbi:flavin reductase family protein [Clostridiisalibacter paucivorans]|uniref:flavin reductase family protein n=1 Tax=Clostridiisalibacter paucivorans TaxID=408753 RepID=UPI00047CFA88|nr:flavin reductase family protein [Clostridiisalibacter paucivorans]